jgi:hypothetical protein
LTANKLHVLLQMMAEYAAKIRSEAENPNPKTETSAMGALFGKVSPAWKCFFFTHHGP